MEKEMNFKVGDYVVYPGHGVGQIRSIETKEIMGEPNNFYSLKILDGGMTISVPQQNVDRVGIRHLISNDEVEDVLGFLKKPIESGLKHTVQLTWNRRHREYMDKIKTGSIYEIAKVLRGLFHLSSDKELSFGERKMLDQAHNLLIKEMALAKRTSESEMTKTVGQIFKLKSS